MTGLADFWNYICTYVQSYHTTLISILHISVKKKNKKKKSGYTVYQSTLI